MNSIAVLIVVDVVGAQAQGLQTNVYLVDTTKYMGSGNEGQAELVTACNDGQVITWNVSPIAPDTNVEISGFTGDMVQQGLCNPKDLGNGGWEGTVEARGQTGQTQYSVELSVDGVTMTFDPFLNVVAG